MNFDLIRATMRSVNGGWACKYKVDWEFPKVEDQLHSIHANSFTIFFSATGDFKWNKIMAGIMWKLLSSRHGILQVKVASPVSQ